MALERRVRRLEAARGARPDPEADAAFARLCAWLEDIGARRARGDPEARADLEALRRMARHGRA